MPDEKKPPFGAVGQHNKGGLVLWAVDCGLPDGSCSLTIYDADGAATLSLDSAQCAHLARDLLSADSGNDFDLATATLRLAALPGQIVAHSHHALLPGELADCHHGVGDVIGLVPNGVGDGGHGLG